jgi:hypothetical protein
MASNVFQNVSSLSQLYLHKNKLSGNFSLSTYFGSGNFTSLMLINLANNLITFFSTNTSFMNFPALQYIYLCGNPYNTTNQIISNYKANLTVDFTTSFTLYGAGE